MKIVVRHIDRCIGCYNCVYACSSTLFHQVSIDRSAVQIRERGVIEHGFVVIKCRACEQPVCARVCPTGALTKREGGGVIFNPTKCDSCGLCSQACTISAIQIDDHTGKPIICIHCGQCVEFCPHGVFEREE